MPSAEDCATLQAYLTGVDQAARNAEAEWGIDRLPLLVDDELRAKFNRQRAKWSAAMEAAWGAKVLTRAVLDAAISSSGAMQRAWAALDAAARAAGHKPTAPDVWEARLRDGTVAAVVRTNGEASKVVSEGRYLAVYSLDEIANVIDALPDSLALAKQLFPGAKVQPQRDKSWERNGDAIPF